MNETRRIAIMLPPGASVRFTPTGTAFSLPLWLYWSQISRQQSATARRHAPSDEMIDAMSASVAGEDREKPDGSEKEQRQETFAAMVAVSAAAFAIDAFYGSVKPLVKPPASKAPREWQIIECLKLGFKIGRHAGRWQAELDWLFETRDNAVHHSETFEPTIVVRTTDATVVAGGPETFDFSAESAERAFGFASEVIQKCLDNPKPPTAEWAELRRDAQRKMAGV
jgi:hypothetical protein